MSDDRTATERVAESIRRAQGHTTTAARAALATGATLVTSTEAMAREMRRQYPGLKARAMGDLRGVDGPLIFDPCCIQEMAREERERQDRDGTLHVTVNVGPADDPARVAKAFGELLERCGQASECAPKPDPNTPAEKAPTRDITAGTPRAVLLYMVTSKGELRVVETTGGLAIEERVAGDVWREATCIMSESDAVEALGRAFMDERHPFYTHLRVGDRASHGQVVHAIRRALSPASARAVGELLLQPEDEGA